MDRLFLAIDTNNIDHINTMIEEGFDVNSENSNGITGLLYAVAKCKESSVLLLLQKGANPNKASRNKTTPLGLSIKCPSILQLLLEHHANVNQIVNENGDLPLLIALSLNIIPSILLLLQSGSDVNFKNKTGTTPFIYALENDRDFICELMLTKYGADPNITFQDISPLQFVCSNKNPSISLIQLLILKGANINYRDTDTKQTALHISVLKNNYEVAQTLINAGADVTLFDARGKQPIDYATTNKMKGILIIPTNPNSLIIEPNSENSIHETIHDGNILAIMDPVFQGQRLIVRNTNNHFTPAWNYILNSKQNPVTRNKINTKTIQYKRAIIMPKYNSTTGGKRLLRTRKYKKRTVK